MIPDHSGLLDKNEAYVAGFDKKMDEFKYIITACSPAYFSGDMLKMNLVSTTEILRRVCLKNQIDPFFLHLNSGLLLSTKAGG